MSHVFCSGGLVSELVLGHELAHRVPQADRKRDSMFPVLDPATQSSTMHDDRIKYRNGGDASRGPASSQIPVVLCRICAITLWVENALVLLCTLINLVTPAVVHGHPVNSETSSKLKGLVLAWY